MGQEQVTVKLVEPSFVDFETIKGVARDLCIDDALTQRSTVIAHAVEQAVGDTRRAARAAGDEARTVRLDGYIEMAGVDINDLRQLISGIKLQALDDAETIAQRRRKAAGTGCGADQRERRQIHGAGCAHSVLCR